MAFFFSFLLIFLDLRNEVVSSWRGLILFFSSLMW